MEQILANMTVSISEFKDNPSKVVKQADGNVFCVLTNNKPSFYVLSPEAWDLILDKLDDLALQPVIAKAAKNLDKAIYVDLEDLRK